MKAKKILGWIIVFATILGVMLVQISEFTLMFDGWMNFLCALGLSIVIFLVEVAISVLIALAIKWITD